MRIAKLSTNRLTPLPHSNNYWKTVQKRINKSI